ncbi:MAG: hypothetical protein JO010_02345 [Alphaproteobacteria bacterium]|nr:hypothetical protein [Alphaproteobacteria bacterium]
MTFNQPTLLDVLHHHGGIVQDAEVAIAIVSAIVRSLCGEEELARQQPFSAAEDDQNWIVRGAQLVRQGSTETSVRAVLDRTTAQFRALDLPYANVPSPPFLKSIMG